MEIYFVNLCFQSEHGKIRTRNNSIFKHFSCSISSKTSSLLINILFLLWELCGELCGNYVRRGGIIVFVRDNIPCEKLDVKIREDIEVLFLEINLRNTKWLSLWMLSSTFPKECLFLSKFKQLLRYVF